MRRGRIMYVPQAVIDELNNISAEEEIDKKSFAFEKMVKYSQVGREARNIYTLKWRKPNSSRLRW